MEKKQTAAQSSDKKQTSVQWLVEKLYQKGFIKEIDGNEPINLMKQALQMEREQIEDSYEVGDKYKTEISGEQYYNKTFKPCPNANHNQQQ